MKAHPCVPFRRHRSFAFSLAALLCVPALAAQEVREASARRGDGNREQKITEIEKQIAALKQQMDDLRREDGNQPAAAAALKEGTLPAEWAKTFKWRAIGPAGMGGRITAISVFEADPSTWWVATASGGLLKTVNNGVTFEHQFDREATVSIGDVCVAPSDKNIVWIGTGENNPRNSVSFGDGVYKSVDGGKTWTNMGLKKSFQTGRVVIHPKNPDIVYVGALGRLYGPNEERGLYKSMDGGKNWQRILYVDDKTGVIDIAMHPVDPETLVVALWDRQRDGFDSHRGEPPVADGYDAYDPVRKWGPGAGIHKTTDGGKSWKKLTKGLPTNYLGRVDMDWYRKDPNTLFAIIDCQKIGMGLPPSRVYLGAQGEDGGGGARLTQITETGPAGKAGLETGDVIKSADKKPVAGYAQLNELVRSKKAGEKLSLEVVRGDKTQEIVVTLEDRPLGGGQGGGPGGGGGGALLGVRTEDAEGGGLRVTTVMEERIAQKAGIEEGDVLKDVDGTAIRSSQQLGEFLGRKKEGDKVTLKAQRGQEAKEFTLTLEEPGGNRARPNTFQYAGQTPNIQDQQGPDSHEYGGVYKSTDAGESWTRINSINPRPMYFSQIRVDPSDDKFLFVLGVSLHRSKDGGKTFTADGGRGVHSDHHAMWIDPKDGRHIILGSDGGFYATFDRADHWDHLNHLAIGQFYHVAVDSRQPYHVYGGLQDNGSWGGPSLSLSGGGTLNEDWISVGGGDGFVCRIDPFDPDLVYAESQNGAMSRRNLRTGERGSIRPAPQRGMRFRFNWNTPFILSNHNPGIFYAAGNYVFRSVKRGDDLRVISPEIARTGRGTGAALAESPRNPDVLWVGTDDGNLWVTRDGGAKWTNVAEKVGLPGPRWVATVEPSRFVEGRCYVAFDAHRSDDDEPYLSVTEDFGQTWKSIRADLPVGSTRCLREDLFNQDLLFAGTEFAAWASLNRGQSWTKLNTNLPTVAVHEFAIHPTSGEVVVATHGRSIWVLDVTPLRQTTTDVMKATAHLFEPNTVVRWRSEPSKLTGGGSRRFRGENPPRGAQIHYALGKKPEKIELKVLDHTGRTVRQLQPKSEPGLHLVAWDLTGTPARAAAPGGGQRGGQGQPVDATGRRPREGRGPETRQAPRGGGAERAGGGGAERAGAAEERTGRPEEQDPAPQDPRGEQGQGQRQGGGRRGGPGGGGGQAVRPGLYRIVLVVDGQEFAQTLRVEVDPTMPAGLAATGGGFEDEIDLDEEPVAAEPPVLIK